MLVGGLLFIGTSVKINLLRMKAHLFKLFLNTVHAIAIQPETYFESQQLLDMTVT